MTSTYSNFQPFFDASTDFVRPSNVEKMKVTSLSSLMDVFAPKANVKSDLFANVWVPTIVTAEVTFPARRNRECDHEIADSSAPVQECLCECPGEESSSLSDVQGSPKVLKAASPNLFSNLDSRYVTAQPETVTFPGRRKRDESWREQRGLQSDWSLSDSVSESTCPEKTVNNKGTVGSREQREVSSSCCNSTVCSKMAAGGNTFSQLYSSSPSNTCSTLFSSVGKANVGSDNIVYPSRRKIPNRNAWRDWSNTGYSDLVQDDMEEVAAEDEIRTDRDVSLGSKQPHPRETSSELRGSSDGNSLDDDQISIHESPEGKCEGSKESPSTQSQERIHSIDAEAGRTGENEHLPIPITITRKHSFGSSTTNHDFLLTVDEGGAGYLGRQSGVSKREFNDQRNLKLKAHSFPPPLVSLRRQGSLSELHHVPCVQLQPLRAEGRFVLQEVKVTQPVVFEPIREQGRLVLQLIQQDETDEAEAEADEQGGALPLDMEGIEPQPQQLRVENQGQTMETTKPQQPQPQPLVDMNRSTVFDPLPPCLSAHSNTVRTNLRGIETF